MATERRHYVVRARRRELLVSIDDSWQKSLFAGQVVGNDECVLAKHLPLRVSLSITPSRVVSLPMISINHHVVARVVVFGGGVYADRSLLGRQQTVHVKASQVPNPRRVRLIDEMNQFDALQPNLGQLIQVGEDVRVDGSQRIAAEV